MGEQINLVINNIAEKLGVGVEKVYPILLKQAYIEGIMGIVGIVLSMSMLFVVYKLVYKYYIEEVDTSYGKGKRVCDWDEFTLLLVNIVVIVVVISNFIVIGCFYSPTITALFNPDYYIIEELVTKLIK